MKEKHYPQDLNENEIIQCATCKWTDIERELRPCGEQPFEICLHSNEKTLSGAEYFGTVFWNTAETFSYAKWKPKDILIKAIPTFLSREEMTI